MKRQIAICFAGAAIYIVALASFAVAPCFAAEGKGDKAAWEVIDKAIAAVNAKRLVELPAKTWNETGTFHGAGSAQPYTGKYAQVFPEKYYMNIADVFVMVQDGDKGWLKQGGATEELPSEGLHRQKGEFYAGYVATLAPLTGDRQSFTATSLGEAEVAGRPALGVAVKPEGRIEVSLWFDKETHLPAKIAYRAMSNEEGVLVDQEITLSEYEDVEGVKTSTKFVILRDGVKYVEGKMSDVKILKALDDSQFAKPQ